MYDPNALYHHGVLGQKWGVRHYQNKDGSYNSAGKKRYGVGDGKPYHSVAGNAKRASAKIYELNEKTYKKLGNKALASMNAAAKNKALKEAAEADKAGAKKKAANAKAKDELTSRLKNLAVMDLSYSKIATGIGYKKAEKKYNSSKNSEN